MITRIYFCIVLVFLVFVMSHGEAREPGKKADDPEKILEALLKRVKQKRNVGARAQAIMELADFGAKAAPALPDLLGALQSKHEELRVNAAITLAKIGTPAVKPVARLLKDPDAGTRFYALWTLAGIGPDARETLPAIIQAMTDKNDEVRRKAAYALGRLADDPDKTIAVLVDAIKDENADVREAAGAALAKFGEAAVPALIDVVKGKNLRMRLHAAAALGEIGADARDAVPFLKDHFLVKDNELAQAYATVLGQIGKASLPALEAGFRDEREEIRQMASAALVQVGADAVPFLVDALGGKRVEIRRLAALTLGSMQVGDKLVVTALGFALADEDDGVRENAMNVLAGLGVQAKVAVPKLKIALTDRHMRVAQQAYYLLHACGEDPGPMLRKAVQSKDAKVRIRTASLMLSVGIEIDKVEPILVAALKNEDATLKMQAALTLANQQRQAEKVLAVFVAGLKDKSMAIRMQSLQGLTALGALGAPAGPALAEAMRDKDVHFRNHLYQAMYLVGGNPDAVLPILTKVYQESDVDVRISVLGVAWRYGAKSKELMRIGLKEKNGKLRLAAIHALYHVEGDRTDLLPLLVPMIQEKQADIRYALIHLFYTLGDAGVPHLGELLKDADSNIRLRSAQVLSDKRLKGEAALEAGVPQLAELLKHAEADVRFAAAVILRELGAKAAKAMPAVKEATKDTSRLVRLQALNLLVQLGGEGPFMVKHFHEEKDGEVRAVLLTNLASSHDRKLVLPLLIPAMKDPAPKVRQHAVSVYSYFDSNCKECFEVFQLGLKDADQTVRVYAAFSASIFKERSWPGLEAALKEATDNRDRQAFLEPLHRTGNRSKAIMPALIECLQEGNPAVRVLACNALANLGSDAALALPQLRELAKDSSTEAVQASARAAVLAIESKK